MRYFLIIVTISFFGCQQSNIAVVDINTLFNDFSYTKEMQAEFIEKTKGKKASLDSLYQELGHLEAAVNNINSEELSAKFIVKRQEFQTRYDRFEAYKNQITEDSDQKILTQLNQYIKDYAESKEIDVILSNSKDDVSILYTSKSYNVTEEVLKFINSKYEGK
ncbi:MAG: hypothetical protein COA58_09895 [Bacteroidetes bacterium]|nr:MAG: hypothetical protein COA58_09895 [Bacteroidota bacterium]